MALTSPAPGQGLRLGILGGTFDPVHIAHLIIAEEARVLCHLDRVLFVPARVSPLKSGEGTLFSAEERYEMVRLAITAEPGFEVSRVDLDRDGPSFTVDTLYLLREQYGSSTSLYFVMGMDSLLNLRAWYRPDEIIRLARLIVVSRGGYVADLAALERQLPGVSAATEMLLSLDIGISSTNVRRRIQQGLPFRYQVPEAVYHHIMAHKRSPA